MYKSPSTNFDIYKSQTNTNAASLTSMAWLQLPPQIPYIHLVQPSQNFATDTSRHYQTPRTCYPQDLLNLKCKHAGQQFVLTRLFTCTFGDLDNREMAGERSLPSEIGECPAMAVGLGLT
ncbi:hypothetical protein RRG08_007765 [Elysia crispata]|uniref:Uncharacterized protein n=1 Tax=Elysia crispata TaxID=231223 RepID=A0AAE1E8I9_9GAST|nr:hypothetical protein RRG08_007765 [Elysia crispata]